MASDKPSQKRYGREFMLAFASRFPCLPDDFEGGTFDDAVLQKRDDEDDDEPVSETWAAGQDIPREEKRGIADQRKRFLKLLADAAREEPRVSLRFCGPGGENAPRERTDRRRPPPLTPISRARADTLPIDGRLSGWRRRCRPPHGHRKQPRCAPSARPGDAHGHGARGAGQHGRRALRAPSTTTPPPR